jgi:hypothetical protein
MITRKAKSRSFAAKPPNAKYVRFGSVAIIVALILGPSGATPGVVVAAQGTDPVDPLLGAVGLEVFPHRSITLGGLSDVDPLLGAMLLGPEKVEISWGTALAQRIVSDIDPLAGAVGLEIGPGSFVAPSGGSDVNSLQCTLEPQVEPGSSFALGGLDPLLGTVGLEITSGSSVAVAEGVLCSNWDLSYPFAPV